MSREYYGIEARFSDADQATKAREQIEKWIDEYVETNDNEFDADDVDIRQLWDELFFSVYSWGAGLDEVEQICLKNNAVKIVELGEFLQRRIVFLDIRTFNKLTNKEFGVIDKHTGKEIDYIQESSLIRKGDIIDSFVKHFKEGKVKEFQNQKK